MSWLNPAAAWWLLLVPALIGLYMLRPRAQRKTVSSLRLWEALPQVERPRARLRRPPLSLLLLMQALLLLAGAAALIQPAFSNPAPRYTVIIVDASGSMQAADGQSSRFEQAKAEARRLAGDMRSEDQATLLRAGEDATTLCSSCKRGDLERAINDMRAGAGRSNIESALRIASGLSGRSPDGLVDTFVISDGGFDAVTTSDLPPSLHFIGVGREAGNRAITVLSARRPPNGTPGYSVYARVVNFSASPASLDVASLADTVPLPGRRMDIPAGGHADLIWQLPPGTARFSMSISPQDALAADDRAALYLPSEGQYTATINAPDPELYRRVFAIVPGFEPKAARAQATASPQTAFTIIEGRLPDTLPSGNLLLVNPSGKLLTTKGEIKNARPLAVGTDHPLLAGLDILPLIVDQGTRVEPLPWLDPVVQSEQGPLLLAGEQDGRRIAVLTFDPRLSNLPKLVAFPLLMSNLVGWLYPLAGTQAITPGDPVYVSPGSVVTAPSGRATTLGNAGVYVDTEEVGLYRAEGGALQKPINFAVNMTSERESNLAVRPHPELERTPEPAQADEEQVTQTREYWTPLAGMALFLVGAEWLFYCWRRGRA